MSPAYAACLERIEAERALLRHERIAAYHCSALPQAVIAGLGMRPVRLICSATPQAAHEGSRLVRPDVCPLVRTLIGNVSLRQGLHALVDIWIGLCTCDHMRRGLDVLGDTLGAEVYPVQLPATRTPEAAAYYASEVVRTVRDIEANHSLSYDETLARQWHIDYATASRALRAIALGGRVRPTVLHAMFHLLCIARPEGLDEFFNQLASSETFCPRRTVLMIGGPLALEDTTALEELELLGIGVVPLQCTGLGMLDAATGGLVPSDIASHAVTAFSRPPCIRARPNDEAFDRIGHYIADLKPDALVFQSLTWCDLWHTERQRIGERFGLPLLCLEADYAEGCAERLRVRIDAFSEVLGL